MGTTRPPQRQKFNRCVRTVAQCAHSYSLSLLDIAVVMNPEPLDAKGSALHNWQPWIAAARTLHNARFSRARPRPRRRHRLAAWSQASPGGRCMLRALLDPVDRRLPRDVALLALGMGQKNGYSGSCARGHGLRFSQRGLLSASGSEMRLVRVRMGGLAVQTRSCAAGVRTSVSRAGETTWATTPRSPPCAGSA